MTGARWTRRARAVLAGGAVAALAGCASTVDVELLVQSRRDAPTSLQVVRHAPDGGAETLALGTLLPLGRARSRFVAERGGRVEVVADGRRVADRAVPDDAPDPLALTVDVE